MSETKFTPGRWVWKYENLYSEIEGEKDKPVLVTDYDVPERTPDDANLIAAAPDLYEALSDIVYLFGQGDNPDEPKEVSVARAALVKARGES